MRLGGIVSRRVEFIYFVIRGDRLWIGDRDRSFRGESAILTKLWSSSSCRRWCPMIFGGGSCSCGSAVGGVQGKAGEVVEVCGGDVYGSEGGCVVAAHVVGVFKHCVGE